jgi:hypothetical protein
LKRILWFSPLAPARTDIANYTERLRSPFVRRADLRLVHPGNGEDIPGSVPISSLTPRDLNQADVCIYQIGNDARFHGAIIDCALRHPGIVVLHDRAINECMLGYWEKREQGAGDLYRSAMRKWYGSQGHRAADAVLRGRIEPSAIAPECPLFEVVLDRALGAVSHNPIVARELRQRFPRLPVLDLPLPYPRMDRAICARPPSPQRFIRLAMFGFMGQNRRLSEILTIWAESRHRDRFQLDLAGELPASPLMEEIGRLGLAQSVRYHGFLLEAELDRMIGEADFALNLRNPTMGEASGSQLRIWANGTASAVTDASWYATLPDDCVVKIRPDHEASDIADLLDALAAGTLDLAEMANRGREYLMAHDPERYVSSLLSWIEGDEDTMAIGWAETSVIKSCARAFAQVLPLRHRQTMPVGLMEPYGTRTP